MKNLNWWCFICNQSKVKNGADSPDMDATAFNHFITNFGKEKVFQKTALIGNMGIELLLIQQTRLQTDRQTESRQTLDFRLKIFVKNMSWFESLLSLSWKWRRMFPGCRIQFCRTWRRRIWRSNHRLSWVLHFMTHKLWLILKSSSLPRLS